MEAFVCSRLWFLRSSTGVLPSTLTPYSNLQDSSEKSRKAPNNRTGDLYNLERQWRSCSIEKSSVLVSHNCVLLEVNASRASSLSWKITGKHCHLCVYLHEIHNWNVFIPIGFIFYEIVQRKTSEPIRRENIYISFWAVNKRCSLLCIIFKDTLKPVLRVTNPRTGAHHI